MKALNTVWAIARILLMLVVAMLVLSAAESRFESVLASSVLMIYAAVRFSAIAQFHNLVDQNRGLTEQFLALAKALNDPDLAQYRSNLDATNERSQKEQTSGTIEGIALILLSIVAVINLVLALKDAQ